MGHTESAPRVHITRKFQTTKDVGLVLGIADIVSDINKPLGPFLLRKCSKSGKRAAMRGRNSWVGSVGCRGTVGARDC